MKGDTLVVAGVVVTAAVIETALIPGIIVGLLAYQIPKVLINVRPFAKLLVRLGHKSVEKSKSAVESVKTTVSNAGKYSI